MVSTRRSCNQPKSDVITYKKHQKEIAQKKKNAREHRRLTVKQATQEVLDLEKGNKKNCRHYGITSRNVVNQLRTPVIIIL